MTTPAYFGDYVRARREELGHSARSLAKQLDIAPTTINRIENRQLITPGVALLVALIDTLALDPVTAVDLLEPYKQLCHRYTKKGK